MSQVWGTRSGEPLPSSWLPHIWSRVTRASQSDAKEPEHPTALSMSCLTFLRLLMNTMSKVSSQPQSRRKLKPSTSKRWQCGLSSPPPETSHLYLWHLSNPKTHCCKSLSDKGFPSPCYTVALQECHQQWDICLYWTSFEVLKKF